MKTIWIGLLCGAIAIDAATASPFDNPRAGGDLSVRMTTLSGSVNGVSAAQVHARILAQRSDPTPDLLLMREKTPPARKPGVAFLLSALVPGAGQLYNGNQRGYAFLGIEAASWFARLSYLDAGNRKQDDYEAFADRHWSYPRFHDTAGEDGCLWTAEADSLIQSYRDEDAKQYYEEIANTDSYRCGWDDFAGSYDPADPDAFSPRRADYRKQREKANQLKDRANLAVAALVLNRIVSAVDAFRVARARQEQAGSYRLESRLTGSPVHPRLDLRVTRAIP
ncbi:MAG: hypothetical protein KC729_11460 [Candidatus Eisenbacteria bacterium]|uniref:DUF5683 domain-containing protein n=1 Tax=Eiseniibacteriota bacterium TaxID=2212470 RepID=A0A956RPL1_UNCEI|nr:hypothetical protein [Candidatus Eisenbacteria bacterium]